jgi:hypothetical protein
MNKARKNRNLNTHVNARKFGAKRLTKVVKCGIKIGVKKDVKMGWIDVGRL